MGQMAGNLGNPNVMNPNQAKWGDLDANEKGSRVLGGTTKGLLNGFNQYQQQNADLRQGGGGAPMPQMQQAQVNPAFFQPQQNRAQNPFYGGYGSF